jgi:hypothetical protein
MPPTQVDIFVLDLSTSNDKASQLRRLNEDLNKSLTSNGLGVPKPISNEIVSGPITTIFTFIEEAATKAETFKIQEAESTIKLWNNELERIFKFSMPDSAYLEHNFSSNNILTPNSVV